MPIPVPPRNLATLAAAPPQAHLSADEVTALMARLGIVPATAMPPSDDPAVVAAAKARLNYARKNKPLSQYITTGEERLGQLFFEYAIVKPQATDLTNRADELSKSIKGTLAAQNPDIDHTVQLYCAGQDHGLAMIPVPKKKTDWDRLAAEHPEILAVIAQYTTVETEWTLRRIGTTKK